MDWLLVGLERQLARNGPWMAWNVGLALLPWVLGVVLFRPRARAGVLWAAGAVICVVALPNAAYVLTDVVHLPANIRREPSDAVVIGVVLPMYAGLFFVGFAAYADTLRRMSRWFAERGVITRRWVLEVSVHAVSAVAIYAGRVHRFNSWDIGRRPDDVLSETIEGMTRPRPVVFVLITFGVLLFGYAAATPFLRLLERSRWPSQSSISG